MLCHVCRKPAVYRIRISYGAWGDRWPTVYHACADHELSHPDPAPGATVTTERV